MKSWIPRSELHTPLLERALALAAGGPTASYALAAAPSAALSLDEAPVASPPVTDPFPEPIADWLTQLTLLYGVPFSYLVPDARLLPPESLRFFYVDANWQDRLLDGALSIGASSTGDTLLIQEVYQAASAQVQARQGQLRATLRGAAPTTGATTAGGTWTGFLFRSVVVSTWPGLEIYATAGAAVVPIIRMDLITSDILLCIFNGLPDTVQFVEPGEGLHFGVDGTLGESTYTVSLRGLGYPTSDPYEAGAQIQTSPGSGQYLTATGSFRTGTGQPAGVLNVGGLVSAIEQAMPSGALGPDNVLTSGGFAIQMVRGAGLQEFKTSQPPTD